MRTKFYGYLMDFTIERRNRMSRMSRRTVLRTGAGLVVGAAGIGAWYGLHNTPHNTYAQQDKSADNIVLQWNSSALQAIAATGTGPTIGARALAITHTSMYDAWTVWDSTAVPTRPNNGIARIANNKWNDQTQAVSYAAYRSTCCLLFEQCHCWDG